MKKFLFSTLLFVLPFAVFAAELVKSTKTYSTRDNQELKLDIYRSASAERQPCLMFMFGGGFKEGERDKEYVKNYAEFFANQGYTTVSIDYRLGMNGLNERGIGFVKAMRHAIDLAVEDLFTATDFLLKNADELKIDPSKIIISGSSAGAITVLHAENERCNYSKSDTILPKDFNYAGVISFAGAILSNKGTPSYRKTPAPTLFFHGTKDNLVVYNKVRLFKLGFFGPKALTKQFRKHKYPYIFYTLQESAHEASFYPMADFREETLYFIRHLVLEKKPWMIDVDFNNLEREPGKPFNAKAYYRKKKN